MTHRERFFSILKGHKPDKPAFFPDISSWYGARRIERGEPQWFGCGRFVGDDHPLHRTAGDMPGAYQDWTYLDFYRNFDWGLPVHIYDWYDVQYDGVDVTEVVEGNQKITRTNCSAGSLHEIHTLAEDGSWAPTRHLAQNIKDLDILRYVIAHTRFVPRYDIVNDTLEAVADQGVCDIVLWRSPFGKLVQDYLGFENVVYALADDRKYILDFLDMQEEKLLEFVKLAAGTSAKLVILSDHADENLIAPPYYQEFCIPFYQKATDILHQAGKFVSSHLDGNFKNYFPLLSETGFDLLDGCTPAPMMNYEVEELAAALPPGMSCYCGVPATLFSQNVEDEQILSFGRRILEVFEGRVILNIGDILPPDGSLDKVVRLGEMAQEYGG